MVTVYILQQLLTIMLTVILAFGGIYLIVKIYNVKNGMDITTLKARAFLDESFLKDNGVLLVIICIFFMINALLELGEIVELFASGTVIISEITLRGGEMDEALIEEFTELGILICNVIIIYKWYKLVKPKKHSIE